MDLLQLLITMAVLFILARVGSGIVSRFGLPGLIGEILMGIVIANLAFGDWSLMEMLGLKDPMVDDPTFMMETVHVFSELGVIFLLFSVGLETKVKDLLGAGKPALLAAVMGVILPFIAGFALIMAIDGNMNHAMFMAAAMVATSVGITARVIKDMHLMDTHEARIIIGAAVIDDVLGMIVLAIVKGMATSGVSIPNILMISVQAILFVGLVILACKFVVPRIYDWFDERRQRKIDAGEAAPGSVNKLVMAIILCLVMAAFAEYIGLAAIIGAFLAGMLLADYAWEWELESKIESITTLLISFFFLNVGLQVDIHTLGSSFVIILSVVVILIALVTKYIGCGLGAKMGDKNLDKAGFNIIGVGMMPRGEVGIIIASIGLATGMMSSELYAVVVMMSVATTIIAPPILSKMFRKKYHESYTIKADDTL